MTDKLYSKGALFVKELPKADEPIDSIYIEGYASTTDIDRVRDVIPPEAWKSGMENYLKNPVILAHHDRDDPCGRMVDYRIDGQGLWIKARISAASEVFNLVRDGIITAFSVCFALKDAEYNPVVDTFIIKQLELLEISVVSVPANQNTLFSLSKNFDDENKFKEFKKLFTLKKSEPTKELEVLEKVENKVTKEFNMDPKEIEKMLSEAAAKAAEEATKALLAKQAEEKALKEAEEKAAKALEDKVKNTVVETIKTLDTGAEKLLEEITKRLEDQENKTKSVLEGLESTIKEKAAELDKIQRSKMQFADRNPEDGSTYEEREKAFLLSKIAGKSIEATKYGKQVIEKTGPHVPSATWELEVSTNMESEVRRRLVVAPIFRSINMQTNVMTIPLNPEAGYATWVTNAQFGTDDSSGAAQTHALTEITLNSYKVATREYLNYEEEEDSLLVLLPIVRDAMVRRTARAVDKAFLRGAGAGADPVKGLVPYDVTSAVTTTTSAAVTVDNMRAIRRDLGAWGLDPSELVYIVSTEVYYDLLDDEDFQTMEKVGNRATLLTGQIGAIGNTPVVVSAEFETKGDGEAAALVVAPANFLVGNQRGLRFETDNLVETQRKVLVASLRTGMTQITTNLGQGVSVLRYDDNP